MKRKRILIIGGIVACLLIGGAIMMLGGSKEVVATPSNSEVVSTLEGDIYTLVSNYSIGRVEEFYTKEDCYAPKDVVISWKGKAGAKSYIVTIGVTEDLSDAQTYETTENSISLDSLYTGTHYYYRVDAVYAEEVVSSQVFDFITEVCQEPFMWRVYRIPVILVDIRP